MELSKLVFALIVASIFKNISAISVWLVVAAQALVNPSALVRHTNNTIRFVSVLFELSSERAYVLNDLFYL